MSDHVNLTRQYRLGWSDWASCEFESPETLADLSYWHVPLKVHFDNAAILLRYLKRLDDEHAMPPEEIWVMHEVTSGRTIEHPTWHRLGLWLPSPYGSPGGNQACILRSQI